ncbi:MAG: DNA repair protein RecO [Acidimicrobiales bacterium]
MNLYRDHGIVLRTYKLGEADRIVVLMTRGVGKLRAVAKGVRKTRSRFGARLEPTSHAALQLYRRRELDLITQAETVDQFPVFRSDLSRLGRASSMLEAVDHLALEREPNPRLYQMLLGALRTLAAQDSPLVAPAFFLKALAAEGFEPSLGLCVQCGAAEELVSFDVREGGVRCWGCRRGAAVSAEALALMDDVLHGRLQAALDRPAAAAVREVEHLATALLEHHVERRLRSLAVSDRT